MARNLTDPNNDDVLEWTERVVDKDGASLTVSLELDAVDSGSGFVQQDTDSSNVSWLDYTTTSSTNSKGWTDVAINITANTSGLTTGNVYRFEITADDGNSTKNRFVKLFANDSGTSYPAWSPGDWSYSSNIDNITGDSDDDIYGIYVRNDGSQFIIAITDGGSGNGHRLIKYDLSTNYELSTYSKVQEESLPTRPWSLTFKPDGTKMFIGEDSGGGRVVQEYSLSTAWDLSTKTKGAVVSIDDSHSGVVFGLDGFMLYTTSRDEELYQHKLSEPYTIDSKYNVVSNTSIDTRNGIAISPDGNTIVSGNGSDERIYIQDLSSPWNITSQSQSSTLYNATGIDDLRCLDVRQDGSQLYVADNYNDVYTYTT